MHGDGGGPDGGAAAVGREGRHLQADSAARKPRPEDADRVNYAKIVKQGLFLSVKLSDEGFKNLESLPGVCRCRGGRGSDCLFLVIEGRM